MEQALFLENRLLLEVTNNSEHEFVPDGEWLRSGDWKPGQAPDGLKIPPSSMAIVELRSNQPKGVSGVAWWVDSKDHDIYVSMAFSHPRLQAPTFSCWAGPPPDDLKTELDQLPRMNANEVFQPEGHGCSWVAPAVGNLTVVKVTINKELERLVPLVAAAAEVPAAASNEASSSSSGAQAAASSSGYPAASAPKAPAPPVDVTTLVATGQPSQPSESNEEAADSLNKFLVQTRPKDALDGVQRGLKTAGTSVVAGVGSVFASAVSGYQQGSGVGLLKGLGTGLVGGAAIAVGGTVCGVAQIGRGIANTPEAIRNRRTQRVWDQELGQWVDIDLVALEAQVAAEDSDDEDGVTVGGGEEGGSGGSKDVVDMEFYDLLSVKSTATASEIKKAYYKEARICHPDKNPGDVEAKAKFQKLADAYQVLSDPATRKKYDKEGKEGIQEGNVKMDPGVFFSLLFGSERFLPWIGELHLAMQTDQLAKLMERGGEDGESLTPEASEKGEDKLKKRQVRREVRCACQLRDKLDRHVYGRDVQGFEEQMRLEAADLAQAQFGPELLVALAEIYMLRAEIYLADELIGRFSLSKRLASLKHSRSTWKHKWSFVSNVAGSVMKVKKVHDIATKLAPKEPKEGEEPEVVDEEQQRKVIEDALDEALPIFLQTAWAAVVTDIDGTIKEVGRKLLKDKSVCWQIRVKRANALFRLGEIFLEEGQKATEASGEQSSTLMTSETAKVLLQEALVGSCREKR